MQRKKPKAKPRLRAAAPSSALKKQVDYLEREMTAGRAARRTENAALATFLRALEERIVAIEGIATWQNLVDERITSIEATVIAWDPTKPDLVHISAEGDFTSMLCGEPHRPAIRHGGPATATCVPCLQRSGKCRECGQYHDDLEYHRLKRFEASLGGHFKGLDLRDSRGGGVTTLEEKIARCKEICGDGVTKPVNPYHRTGCPLSFSATTKAPP